MSLDLAQVDDVVPSGFETNAGSFARGRRLAAAATIIGAANKGSFKEFQAKRKAAAGKPAVHQPPEVPTAERQAKDDRPKKTKAGFYRAPPPIERLRDRNALDRVPQVAAAMSTAAETLYQDFYLSGLNGVQAQDLSRAVHGGGTTTAGYPRTERIMHHRRRFRDAIDRMGWFPDHPHRGAGRLVVEVVCYQIGVEDAAKLHVGSGRNQVVVAGAMDRLREGLFALAKFYRLI